MIKTLKLLFGTCIALGCTSDAAIITLSGSSVFLSDQTTLVPQNSLISVGYFSDTFTDFGGLSSRTWADITSIDFTQITTGTINPSAGEWSGGSDIDGIEGKDLYVWVFDSTSAPTFVSDVEFGLFTSSSSEWTGKADAGIPPTVNSLTIESVDSAIYGVDLGTNLALVPEPAHFTALFGIIALAVIFRRNKRKSF